MRVLVLGGTRFMGRAVVELLIASGHEVLLFNRGNQSAPMGVSKSITGDRNDPSSLELLRSCDAEALVDMSAYTGKQSEALMSLLGGIGIYVHISSGAVYQPTFKLPWPEETPDGPWDLWGQYGVDKLAAEEQVRTRDPGLSTYILRFPYVLGPANYADREEFIFNRLLDDEQIFIPGDGEAVQQFLSLRQVAESVHRCLLRAAPGVNPYNIASPGLVPLSSLVAICGRLCDRIPRVVPIYGLGVTGTGDGVFDAANCVFPFPNANYALDLQRSEVFGVAPSPVLLEDTLEESLRYLVANDQRRKWERTKAELVALGRPR